MKSSYGMMNKLYKTPAYSRLINALRTGKLNLFQMEKLLQLKHSNEAAIKIAVMLENIGLHYPLYEVDQPGTYTIDYVKSMKKFMRLELGRKKKLASNEMTWRKLPRNIITDPAMDYIASMLQPEYAAAPYMFYMVAMSIADDDGIFDLEDGIIFSRLMHIGDPTLVIKIANLMLQRKIIVRAGNTTKCMLTAWGYSNKEVGRTLEERRRIVARKIEQEQQARSEQFSKLEAAAAENEPTFTLDFNNTSVRTFDGDFFGPDDDKNAKNVVKKNQTEKIREDKNRLDLEKNTHREEEKTREQEKLALQATANEPYAPAGTEIQETSDNGEPENYTDVSTLAAQALSVGSTASGEEEKTRLFDTFLEFFAKNCLGLNKNGAIQLTDEQYEAINELCRRCLELQDDKNPAEIIAINLLGQFKKLSEDEGYYQGTPLLPEELLKPGMYKHALAGVSRILLTNKPKTPAWQKQLEEAAAEKEQVYDVLDQQYIQYGIDPNDPNRAALLMQAQRGDRTRSGSP